MSSPKILVVYYSHAGTTATVAHYLAKNLRCDVEAIRECVDREGLAGWFRSARDASLRRATPIQPMTSRAQDYDLILVGTPVLASSLAAPVRSYLDSIRGKAKRVAFFLTHGGFDRERVFGQMEDVIGTRPEAALAFTEARVESGAYRSRADNLVSYVRELLADHPEELQLAMAS
ncbi:MAG TPA: hypothetical protein VHM19_06405 [Polyangiales bacterium]|nr:hypothetical protein [Polyangiales bacterium]